MLYFLFPTHKFEGQSNTTINICIAKRCFWCFGYRSG